MGTDKDAWKGKIKRVAQERYKNTSFCTYRGDHVGLIDCKTCKGNVKLKTYKCHRLAKIISQQECRDCPHRLEPLNVTGASSIDIALSRRCNLSCDFCYAKNETTERPVNFSMLTKTLDWFMFQAQGLSAKKSRHINVYGGEPLLEFESLVELHKYVSDTYKVPVTWNVVTNMTMLDDDKLEWLIANKVSISVSIDGCPVAQDTHRHDVNGVGTSEIVFENLKKLLKYKPNLMVRSTVTPLTVGYMRESVEYLYVMGVRNVQQILASGMNWDSIAMSTYRDECHKIADWWTDLTRNRIRFKHTLIDKGYNAFRHIKKATCCSAARSLICVDSKGDIWPCHRFAEWDTNHPAKLGNIFECGYTNLQYREALNSHALYNHHGNQCVRCFARSGCGGHCMYEMELEGGYDKDIPIKYSPVYNQNCERNRIHYEVFQRIYDELRMDKFFQSELERMK